MDGKDTESRFSMLLKPIRYFCSQVVNHRELADNWNIDVAAELEEYLEDLESLSQSTISRNIILYMKH